VCQSPGLVVFDVERLGSIDGPALDRLNLPPEWKQVRPTDRAAHNQKIKPP
jgi:hypothetical protein